MLIRPLNVWGYWFVDSLGWKTFRNLLTVPVKNLERKQIGVRVILFLVFMTGLTYAVKRQVWSDVDH